MNKKSSQATPFSAPSARLKLQEVNHVAFGQVPIEKQQQYVDLHQAGDNQSCLELAESFAAHYPDSRFAWKALGSSLLRNGALDEAERALNRAASLQGEDPEVCNSLARVYHAQGRTEEAIKLMHRALEIEPDFASSLLWLCREMADKSQYDAAIELLDNALLYSPEHRDFLKKKANLLLRAIRHGEAAELLESLCALEPDNAILLHSLGNAYYNLGRFEDAENKIQASRELDPTNFLLASDHLLLMHYNPHLSAETIHQAHLNWDALFATEAPVARATVDQDPDRRIRVGMISAGFRIHPVGQMITSCLQFLPREDIELYCYTMNDKFDPYTQLIQRRSDEWRSVIRLSNEELAERIAEDRIDILIDLCGHTEGNRCKTIAMRPAPLQVKWVGGQINTTGLTAMDYMITDHVETPEGVDHLYTEKLIRLPDDYICYIPRGDTPSIGAVPALENGYITFGCFNNPTKINAQLIEQWASLLLAVEHSRLFLKGSQFGSEELCGRVRAMFKHHGIDEHRIHIEGRSPHVELLDAYNRVDIALDPWPYSGGLTTCEAILMGVPVITLPGPTFAGRHSATHLTNAGLAHLVARNWQDYRRIAIGLASDIPKLEHYRSSLRQQLQHSPVCDAHRFARHLNSALRAIWQRHCSGKNPTALSFNPNGQMQFANEDTFTSVRINELPNPRDPNHSMVQPDFVWSLERHIVVMDCGSKLLLDPGFDALASTNAFQVIGFDPASRVPRSDDDGTRENVQVFQHTVLGDGKPSVLHACIDPAWSSVCEPLPADALPGAMQLPAQVLTTLPISTLALDDIEGMNQLDWLILDTSGNPLTILENGRKTLESTLLLQIRCPTQPRYLHQPDLSHLIASAAESGFTLHCLTDLQRVSSCDGLQNAFPASQLDSVDLLFVPCEARLAKLQIEQLLTLSFILHNVFNIRDLPASLIHRIDPDLAQRYIRAAAHMENPQQAPLESFVRPGTAKNQDKEFNLPTAPHMSRDERELFARCLSFAESYFEFGSGGSTVWAVAAGLEVHGVESDAQWVNALTRELGDRCHLVAVDIGEVGEWGMPTSNKFAELFVDYSRAIHQLQQPFDLILVDGRFRVACAARAIEHTLRHNTNLASTRIFIHDFWNREQYHPILEFLELVERVETAGVFTVREDLDRAALRSLWESYAHDPA
ncbi:hypothetical protein A3709_07620 [Halioglobus sp. HI00S01]|uniref:O-linked N-acetylglucosamine transferase, SPINDLY family protein n=1 Tax=Halioglobus sp. HI00S01 TaxID=1822214 RepID=UPI0007C27DDC|nr:tetratricopeptide repeat protein [Halioglobus sp. HI00S01]KZX54884.1 hypothetical protein A3709_07620 [Halioglobus sp. HI00S01]